MAHVMPHKLFGFDKNKLQCFINPYILLKILTKNKKRIYRGVLKGQ